MLHVESLTQQKHFLKKESAWYVDIKENVKPRARNRCEGIITMTTEIIIIIITDSVQGIILSVLHIFTPMLLLLLSRFSRVQLCATPETAAQQASPSLGFSRQEHWSGLPFPSPMHESEK